MDCILAIDVGNTNVVIGLYNSSNGSNAPLEVSWRLMTSYERTADEYGLLTLALLTKHGLNPDNISGIVISNVIPSLQRVLSHWLKLYFKSKILWVSSDIDVGINILIDNPKELGSDRIVNAVGAIEYYGAPVIVVDFGTATCFDVINEKCEYLGTIISPGLSSISNALYNKASYLPRVDIVKPKQLVGKNTIDAIQSGLYYGYIDFVDGILSRLLNQYDGYNIIATGGSSTVIASFSKYIKIVTGDLTLGGLYAIWLKNKDKI